MARRKIIPYRKDLKPIARMLRNNMTKSETLLWNKLKNKQMKEYDFDRQRPIDRYIVDFYCKDLQLAIEVDGTDHSEEKDFIRQQRLESLGVSFLRFKNSDVISSMDEVLNTISLWIDQNGDKHLGDSLK